MTEAGVYVCEGVSKVNFYREARPGKQQLCWMTLSVVKTLQMALIFAEPVPFERTLLAQPRPKFVEQQFLRNFSLSIKFLLATNLLPLRGGGLQGGLRLCFLDSLLTGKTDMQVLRCIYPLFPHVKDDDQIQKDVQSSCVHFCIAWHTPCSRLNALDKESRPSFVNVS